MTQAGFTSLTATAAGIPPPAGFETGTPAHYYDLATTAVFTGAVTVCINYTGISFPTPPGPSLFHFENGNWVNRTTTVNTNTRTVCGVVTSLSPFALFQPAAVAATSISVSPTALNPQYTQGTSPTAFSQTFSLNSTPAGVPYTVVSSASWLTAPAGYSTAAAFTVTWNAAGFAPGTYGATLTVSSANGSVQIPISLTVLPPPTLLSQPASPQLTAAFGAPAAGQDIQLTSGGASIPFTGASSAAWLKFSASATATPAILHIVADPTGLPAASYQGAITLTAPGAANSPYSIPVSILVTGTGALGQSAVENSASFSASVAAPNTILTLFGPLACNSNPQVLVNGAASQILFAGASQINFVVPAGLASVTRAQVQAICNGAVVETAPIDTAAVAPAIFTQSASGSGPGSIVNPDGTVNSAANPAPRGNFISVYVTGFGTFNSPSPDGLRRLTNGVTATIGGLAANVLYAGEAPTETAGLKQINILVPPGVQPGLNAPVVMTVGGVSTQAGITLTIQ